jgi:hypothetical protein
MEGEGFEPSKRNARQVYSLIPLATRTPLRNSLHSLQQKPFILSFKQASTPRWSASWRSDLNQQPPVYKTGALPIELRQQGSPPKGVVEL